MNCYGSSEAGMACINFIKTENFDEDCVGFPLPGNQIEIVDEKDSILSNENEGLIRAKTPYMASGYYNNEKETKKFFKDGWFYSGDTGYLTKNGELVLTGRSDERINLNGVKVNPSKIDRIMESYPDIKEAACFPLTKKDGSMVACVALVVNFEIDLTKLIVKPKFNFNEFKKFLLDHLTESAIKQTIFIKVAKIYRNDNGKILRSKLSE